MDNDNELTANSISGNYAGVFLQLKHLLTAIINGVCLLPFIARFLGDIKKS